MKIKICGLTQRENIIEILSLNPDFIGFIFYPFSPRYFQLENLNGIDFGKTKKTGVFVNEKPEIVLTIAEKFNLDFIQLHGTESPEYCRKLKENGIKIIKTFSVHPDFNFDETIPYSEYCGYFLFDTKVSGFGGSGKKFNWDLLNNYHNQVPFFVSGGISENDADSLIELKPKFNTMTGADINSCFESSPGIKNSLSCMNFIKQLNNKLQLK